MNRIKAQEFNVVYCRNSCQCLCISDLIRIKYILATSWLNPYFNKKLAYHFVFWSLTKKMFIASLTSTA